MKVIFLDIDGVLNNEVYSKQKYDEWEKLGRPQRKRFDENSDNFDPRCMELLNELITSTGAEVVISSAWRSGHTKEELQVLFEQYGFKHKILDYTPRMGHAATVRGNEIKWWIHENKELIGPDYWRWYDYVILDDDSDMLLEQRNNFLCINGYMGLTPKDIYKAEFILNGRKEK